MEPTPKLLALNAREPGSPFPRAQLPEGPNHGPSFEALLKQQAGTETAAASDAAQPDHSPQASTAPHREEATRWEDDPSQESQETDSSPTKSEEKRTATAGDEARTSAEESYADGEPAEVLAADIRENGELSLLQARQDVPEAVPGKAADTKQNDGSKQSFTSITWEKAGAKNDAKENLANAQLKQFVEKSDGSAGEEIQSPKPIAGKQSGEPTTQANTKKVDATPAAELAAQLKVSEDKKPANRSGAGEMVEVDGKKWKISHESSPVNVHTASDQKDGSNPNQADARAQQRGREKLDLPKAAEPVQRTDGEGRRFLTMTEMAGELRTATSPKPGAEAGSNRQLFSELVERARVNLGPDGRSTASIRMNPQQLGRMTLDLQIQDGRLQAKLLVDNVQAERLLKQDIEGLRRDLKAHGIQLEAFSIRVREPSTAFEMRGENQQSQTQQEGTQLGNRSGQGQPEQPEAGHRHAGLLGRELDPGIEYEGQTISANQREGLLNVSA